MIAWSFLKVLGGCINAVLALFVTLLAIGALIDLVIVHRFKKRYRGKWLLVASPRHGWHDFIRNNVVPVLPADTEFVLTEGTPFMWASLRLLRVKEGKPLLIQVTQECQIKHASLRDDLLPLRRRAARNAEVQREVAAIIAGRRARMVDGE